MTAPGAIVIRETPVPALLVPESPVRPGAIPGPDSLIATKSRMRSVDTQQLADLVEVRRRSLHHTLLKLRRMTGDSPSSMTLHARLAEAAHACGRAEEAVVACLRVYAVAVQRIADLPGVSVEFAALTVVTRILQSLGRLSEADEYLASFPDHGSIGLFKAQYLMADDAGLDQAAAILADLDDEQFPSVHGLRGYVLLTGGAYREAVQALARARESDPHDVDAVLNLASAHWQLGSAGEAVGFARQARDLAPGRYDAVMALLGYLVETGQFDAARLELDRLRERNFVDTSESVMLAAQVEAGLGNRKGAGRLLKRSRDLAAETGDPGLTAELDGCIALFDLAHGRIAQPVAVERLRAQVYTAPGRAALVAMLADLVNHNSDAHDVRRAFDEVDRRPARAYVKRIESQLAFLERRYDDAVRLVIEWNEAEPLDSRAIRLRTFWDGGLNRNWAVVGGRALEAAQALGGESSVVNAATYALAMAGQGREAVALVESAGRLDYVLTATAGLAHMSAGDIGRGLSLYRQAAQMAERDSSDPNARIVMTQYQAISVRHLDLDPAHAEEIRGGALPPMDLPDDWDDIAELSFLREVARRRGWEWPVRIA